MSRSFSTNLSGKVRNFPLPKNRPLVPLYEAVVNSIHAIDERKSNGDVFDGRIEIEVVRDRTLFSDSDSNTVRGFRIADNGIGFDENNMKSFMEADSEYKMAIGGKGVGRFSWLKAFSEVHIKSVYKEEGKFVVREFDFTTARSEIEDVLTEEESGTGYCTEVTLSDYLKDYKSNAPKKLDIIAMRIIQHCLAYFLRKDCPAMKIYDTENSLSLNQIFRDIITTNDNQTQFEVKGQKFNLLHIKITDRLFGSRNRLYLCANERLVDSKELEKLIVDLDSDIFDNEEYWYLGVLTSEYFDENVDMNRLSFSLPTESSVLLPGNPGLDDIVKEACHQVELYLADYLQEVKNNKQERITKYTTETAPQYRHLAYYEPDKIAALKPGLSDEALDDALYGIKREFENKTKTECRSLLNQLEKGTISSEEYQSRFQKTIGKVSDVNRAALAEYVVHRRIILDLFSKGVNIKDDGKFNLEKYMHQLIYPMRATSDEIPYENHNLWLIDEKLSFCQFISSDKPFDNKFGEERTDILALDSPVAIAENKNNGMAYDTVIIFELKKPMRDDYNMEKNPITQLTDYAQRILDGKVKDSNHRKITVTDSTQFYLYAVCDITPSLERVLNTMSFTRTPDRLGAYFYNGTMHTYIEVLSYDKVRNDSEKRNKVLFDKLGI
ncbi:MAG: ATP-binding protein [Lachnospiraceae bacterium]